MTADDEGAQEGMNETRIGTVVDPNLTRANPDLFS